MESYMKALEPGVWNAVIFDYIPPKRIRTPAQKKSKKNNANAMEAILHGLPQSIKKKIGPCVSAKEIWVNFEKLYSNKEIAQASLAIVKDGREDIIEDEENLFIGTVTQASEDDSDMEGEENLKA